jgi:hypothetical protein
MKDSQHTSIQKEDMRGSVKVVSYLVEPQLHRLVGHVVKSLLHLSRQCEVDRYQEIGHLNDQLEIGLAFESPLTLMEALVDLRQDPAGERFPQIALLLWIHVRGHVRVSDVDHVG